MVSIIEMHSYGIILIIPAYCAFVLTDPLFRFFQHIQGHRDSVSYRIYDTLSLWPCTCTYTIHCMDAQVMTLLMENVLPVLGWMK